MRIRLNSLLLLVIFFCIRNSYCQGLNNFWLLGYDTVQGQNTGRTTIDFSNGSASVGLSYSHTTNFTRASATIADTSGNLLFYTNGFDVCNRNGEIMPNGFRIDSSVFFTNYWYKNGMPIAQPVLIIPFSEQDSLYYLFHETAQPYFLDTSGFGVYYPSSLYYSVISMTRDSGRGDLIVREQIIFQDTLALGRITAVKHGNGRDWWIMVYRYAGDKYLKLLLTPNGISPPIYQQIGPRLNYCDLAQAVFSPQGDKYAIADKANGLLFMEFDRCSGTLSNPIQVLINDTAIARGAAFSASGRYLYVSSSRYLYQFDTWSSNFAGSQDTVAVWDGFYSTTFPFATTFYLSQLAPDNKIYINSPNSVKTLHVINFPDSGGAACDVCQHCISLPTYNAFTIPNHPNYFLGADSGSVCDTLQLGINERNSNRNSIFRVHPNPAVDIINLNFTPNDHIQELEIINVNGKIVLKRNIPQWSQFHQIDVSKLKSGIYLCRLKSQGNIKSCKFIKE